MMINLKYHQYSTAFVINNIINSIKKEGLKYGLVYTPTQDHSEVNQKSSLIQKLKATL